MDEKIDKRFFKRLARRFILRVALDDGSLLPSWSLVTTDNLSVGGASFVFDQEVRPGQRLLFKLHFLEREIDCCGQVVRIKPVFQKPLAQLAVRFEWENEKDRAYVDEFSKRRAEDL